MNSRIVGIAITVLLAVLLVPSMLGFTGRPVMIVAVHTGAMAADIVEPWGDTIARVAMVLGSGTVMLLGFALLVGSALMVALAVGFAAEQAGRWVLTRRG